MALIAGHDLYESHGTEAINPANSHNGLQISFFL